MRIIVVVLAVFASLALAPGALAWDGASVDLVSCPELHATLPDAPGPWKVQAREGAASSFAEFGRLPLLVEYIVPAHAGPTTIGNFYLPDDAAHIVTVAVGNAADMADGFAASQPTQMLGCGRPFYTKQETYNKQETNALVQTIVLNTIQQQTRCTGRGTRRFTLRPRFNGRQVIGATASEPGFRPRVRAVRLRGVRRFRISWSTRGKTFTAGGVLRTMTVHVHLEGDGNVRTVYLWRPCVQRDGNPNDPSAASNHGDAP